MCRSSMGQRGQRGACARDEKRHRRQGASVAEAARRPFTSPHRAGRSQASLLGGKLEGPETRATRDAVALEAVTVEGDHVRAPPARLRSSTKGRHHMAPRDDRVSLKGSARRVIAHSPPRARLDTERRCPGPGRPTSRPGVPTSDAGARPGAEDARAPSAPAAD